MPMSGEQLLSAFHRFRDALFACDTDALDSLLASDFQGCNLRGELEDRDVILDAYRPGITRLTEFEVSELRVEVFSEVGILTGEGYVAGTWKGNAWSHRLRFCDIYVARDGAWKLLLSQATATGEG